MKKIYLFLFALVSTWQINAQVLNQNAGWPNLAWTVTGTYNADPLAFEADPTTTANFAFDDDDAGNGSVDDIAAESPVINLGPAVSAGETKVRVSAMSLYNRLTEDVLVFQYWDADALAWTAWSGNVTENSTVQNNFCTGTKTMFTTPDLDVAGFTATQLAGFRYRIAFDDALAQGSWDWGFCFDAPTIISIPQPCLSNSTLWPTTTVTTGICDGFTSTLIADDSWAGDYAEINVVAGETYKFASSVGTDFFTISTDGNVTAIASGVSPLTWVSSVTGVIRLNINTSITCGTENVARTTTVVCGVPCLNGGLWPAATFATATCDGTTVNVIATDSYAAEYSNVQVFALGTYTFASSVATDYITIASADASTIYAVGTGSVVYMPSADEVVRVYFHLDSTCGAENVNREKTVVCTSPVSPPNCIDTPPVSPLDGATDAPAFADITLAWNPPTTGDAPTSYNLYIGFAPGTLTLAANVGNVTSINAGQVGAYDTTVYWMVVPVNAAGEAVGCTGTEWSFTTESNPIPAPLNDDCSGAFGLTAGIDFAANDIVASNEGATNSGEAASTCTPTVNEDVWYSIVVPSTTLTIETQIGDGTITDPVLVAYSGTCGALTEIGCSDDIDFAGGNYLARMDLTGLTIGDTIYFRLYTYGEVGTILLSAWDGTLANTTFDNGSFSAVPNPVKDILNISFSQNIEKVQVMNLLGQEVMTKAINATQSQVDMSNLAQGTYLVKVTADGQVKTIKVIKE